MSVFLDSNLCNDVHEEEYFCRFDMSVLNYKYRLDLMGYTLKRAKREFSHFFDYDKYFEDLEEKYKPDIRKVDFDFFVSKLNEFLDNREENIGESELLKHMFDNDWPTNNILGFPISDIRLIVRIIAEFCDNEDIVTYDMTDLINSGYFIEGFDFLKSAKNNLKMIGKLYDKIIIITEGKADIGILRKAFELKYQEEKEFFEFFDYSIQRLPGSTSEVLKLVKTFATVGIKNRTIVLFDNDTAGRAEFERFKSLNIPDNIRGTCYPNLEIGNNYPTIKEDILHYEDINGRAVSIELFLGDSILKRRGCYLPIEWKNNNQGVICEKESVKKQFYKMCKENPENIDWKDIDKIFQILINVFV